jgi:hypothetical protein
MSMTNRDRENHRLVVDLKFHDWCTKAEAVSQLAARLETMGPIKSYRVQPYMAAVREDESSPWHPIKTAPKSGYIIGAWKYGSRWVAAQVFDEHDEWVDVHTDRIRTPTHWIKLPEDEND